MAGSMRLNVYLDKAIQTDSSVFSIPPHERGSVVENDTANNLAIDPPLATSLDHCDAAYIYSETQLSDESVSPKSSFPSRQPYGQLHYNRPRLPTKRVVSLPEGCTDNLHVDKSSQRVVSMPERLKPVSPDTSSSFSSLDISSVSFESNALDLAKHSGMQAYSCSHSDIPSTPSPPSSPESILIIGSNSQVPRTLLRSKTAYKQTYGDNGGWISWANSPPRPIPALHGPLSLPYARCPSGAEGTIIEGEDLVNMIWGLNAEENRSHSLTNTVLRSQYAPPRLQKSPKPSTCALPTDGTIDLSQLAVLRPNSSEGVTTQCFVPNQGANISYGRAQHCLKVGRTRPQEMPVTDPSIPDWKRGLGFNWQEPIELPPPQNVLYQDADHSTLKASTPPFIPSNRSVPRGLPHLVVESRLPDFVQNVNQGHSTTPYLPTPPITSSPLWSPHVATPSDMDVMSPQISLHGLPENKQILLSQLFSPCITLKNYTQDYHWVSEQLESVAKLKIASPDGVPAFPTTAPTDVVNLDNFDKGNVLSPKQDPNKATMHLVSDLAPHVVTRGQKKCIGRNASTSPEGRFRGISQQPRSIPLARLIQRRLSSVAEEDVNALAEEGDASLTSKLTYTVTFSENMQTATTIRSNHVTNRIPSPDIGKLEPRTCQEPDIAVSNDQASKKAVVKLPGVDVSSKGTRSGGKEKHTTTPTGIGRKKTRIRRNRSSSVEVAK